MHGAWFEIRRYRIGALFTLHGALVEIRRYRVEALLGVTKISKGNPTIISGLLASNIMSRSPIFMLHWRMVRHAWGHG